MGKGGALGGRDAIARTATDRRALRQEYRQLFVTAVDSKDQLEDAGSTVLKTMLDKVEVLRDKVEKPREHAVDAGLFCHLTECGLTLVSRGHAVRQGRTPAMFVTMLRHAYGGEEANSSAPLPSDSFHWSSVGDSAAAFCAPAPGMGCMLGPLDVHAKARAAAQRKKRQAAGAAEVVHAQELEAKELSGEEQHKQETDRNMLVMWECLQRAGGTATFVSLVLNHASFGQTVENTFTLSFLVRDRRVSLKTDSQRGLLVKATSKAEAAAAAQGGAGSRTVQIMMSFDMERWGALCDAVDPSDCLMPHRTPHVLPGAGAGGSGGEGGRGSWGPGKAAARQQRRVVQEEEEDEDEEEGHGRAAAGRSKRARRGC